MGVQRKSAWSETPPCLRPYRSSCIREGSLDRAPHSAPREGPRLERNEQPGVVDLRSGDHCQPSPNYGTLEVRGTGEEKTENPEVCEEGG
ncbi:hypothetical protein NDU88_007085 [Pleurodeles waltl]|uniref:Uncharacterized protein n=1 Tax=Pleurodeles waltl TaxID=8319 RepID=A0AAV7VST1_PLEWA|nr:hypothetical protein NDU88_007085 [Pleurodeles waltl]